MKIYVLAEYYAKNSYGNRCLYEFAYQLNKLNFETYVVYCRHEFSSSESILEKYKPFVILFEEDIKLTDFDIVIYPDTILGKTVHNPLNAKNVVRWMLNKSSVLTGNVTEYADTDLVVSYSKYVNKDLPQLFFLIDERDFFQNIKNNTSYCRHDKKTVSVYFGKVNKDLLDEKYVFVKKIVSKYSKINIITRGQPSREEALQMISNSDLLISYDGLTNLNYESMLLGTPVLLLDNSFVNRDIKFNINDNGYIYDIKLLAKVKKQIHEVYEAYDYYCNNLNKTLKNSIDFIENKLLEIHQNGTKNKEINDKLKKNELEFFDEVCRSNKLLNINFISDIPYKTAKILRVNIDLDYIKTKIKKYLKLILLKMGLYKICKWIYLKLKFGSKH